MERHQFFQYRLVYHAYLIIDWKAFHFICQYLDCYVRANEYEYRRVEDTS